MANVIDLVHLRTFVAVAEEQNLTRAAERIHISQSAASNHIRALEDSLGSQLFIRTNRNLPLTPAGEQLLRRAKSLLHEATLFNSYARELRGQAQGKLVIAASAEPAGMRIGEVLVTLREQHPLILASLRARTSGGIRDDLRSGEADVGILLDFPKDRNLTYIELASVPFRIAGPIAWKEALETADWATLADLPWITPADSGLAYATLLANLFEEKGLRLNSVADFDNAVLGRTLVAAGLGLMLMREEHALEGVAAGRLAISPRVRPQYCLYFAHLASRKNDPLIQAFLDAARCVWPAMREYAPDAA